MTANFTRAVNAGHAEAVARTRMQQQQAKPVNTRPLDENGSLFGALERSADGLQKIAFDKIPVSLASKAVLNEEQFILNELFSGQFFDRTDITFPYDLEKGQKVADKNIARGIAIVNWLLFNSKNTSWSSSTIQGMKDFLRSGGRFILPEEIQRQLDLALKLHIVLKNNEEAGSKRDDAKALAEGLKAIIQSNTSNGQLNEARLINDIKRFLIDVGSSTSQSFLVSRITDFKSSNAAYNLFAGGRIRTIGWKDKFVDGTDPTSNQAHHFSASFIDGLLYPSKIATARAALVEANLEGNTNDIALSETAIDLAQKVKNGKLSWDNLPVELYNKLRR